MKSYLKWAGSKSRILSEVLDAIGDCSDKLFVEPFVGSGTVALNVEAKYYKLSDFNKKLINTHKAVAKNSDLVNDMCEVLFYSGVDQYYNLRNTFNEEYNSKSLSFQAALFIYLNKHSFNGLYRENRKGGYNVPVNANANPSVPTTHLREFGSKFDTEDFFCSGFEYISNILNSVIYIDPPYPADSISESEISYTKDGFSVNDHIRLHDHCVQASKNGNRVVVSYCDIPFIRELYGDADEIREIQAMRSISSKSGTRGKVQELLIIYRGSNE